MRMIILQIYCWDSLTINFDARLGPLWLVDRQRQRHKEPLSLEFMKRDKVVGRVRKDGAVRELQEVLKSEDVDGGDEGNDHDECVSGRGLDG